MYHLASKRAMVASNTCVDPPFDRKPSVNSTPTGFSTAAETMRIGTSGFSSFISFAISVPSLSLRKWSAMTKSIGLCSNRLKPSSAELGRL